MNSKLLILVFSLIAANLWAQLPGLPEGRITVQVIDETGNPISNAKVVLAFDDPHPSWGSTKEMPVSGLTNADGTFSGSGACSMTIGGKVELNGYYLSFLPRYQFKSVQEGKCQPWNPTIDVVLKKIIQPVPMFAKQVRATVPAFDQAIGFDLAAGDWVVPFGAGKNSDFIFTLSRTLNSPSDYTAKLLLSFSNQADGIQIIQDNDKGKSVLKLPRSAPQDGYVSSWSTSLSHGSFGSVTAEQNFGYFFRVHSTIAGDKITLAQYGKIDGSISIVGAAAEKPGIVFTYYLNPNGTTNLEFDPTKNLLTNLKDEEQVDAP